MIDDGDYDGESDDDYDYKDDHDHALAAKHNILSLIPGPHLVEGENWLPPVVLNLHRLRLWTGTHSGFGMSYPASRSSSCDVVTFR